MGEKVEKTHKNKQTRPRLVYKTKWYENIRYITSHKKDYYRFLCLKLTLLEKTSMESGKIYSQDFKCRLRQIFLHSKNELHTNWPRKKHTRRFWRSINLYFFMFFGHCHPVCYRYRTKQRCKIFYSFILHWWNSGKFRFFFCFDFIAISLTV